MNNKKKILFSGELPPTSVHGVSLSNDINLNVLSKRFKISVDEEVVNLRFHGYFDFRKAFNFFNRFSRIVVLSCRKRFDYLYIVLSTSTAGAIKTLVLILIFKIFNRGNVVVHIHRGDLEKFINSKTVNAHVFSFIEKLTSSFIVLSDETKAFLNYRSKVKAHVLENTVTHEKYSKALKPDIGPVYDFVFISNYIEEKGILILLDTFKNLPTNYVLNCYGNYSDLTLKSTIEEYNKYENIFINTSIQGEEKFERIYKADALILPSFNEGKPLVLLEAMSVGTPFIATDVGYIKEISYENYPYLYTLNNVENLLSKIKEFTASANNTKISILLKERYNKKFSNKVHAEKLNEIFK